MTANLIWLVPLAWRQGPFFIANGPGAKMPAGPREDAASEDEDMEPIQQAQEPLPPCEAALLPPAVELAPLALELSNGEFHVAPPLRQSVPDEPADPETRCIQSVVSTSAKSSYLIIHYPISAGKDSGLMTSERQRNYPVISSTAYDQTVSSLRRKGSGLTPDDLRSQVQSQ